MEKLKIVLLDNNPNELELYGRLCLAVAKQCGVQTEILPYAESQRLLFDMDDTCFNSSLSIFIVEPDGGNAAIPLTVRKTGYKGLILYLSRLCAEEYFLQAFDAKAFNFLKKGEPHMKRFYSVFEQTLKAAERLHREYIVVSGYGEYKQIQIGDIYYFESRDKLVTVHYGEGKFEFYSTLQKLEERLSDRGFIRVSRSFLVSLEAIHKPGYDKLILNDGTAIPVGRAYASALKAAVDRRQR
ncbi:MAG: LytTR family transcriptional regulator [Oscillospiraceae bacterium]|nr:LytTR family transcriptional regulator [Oscillospiraceae bacterium]